MLSAIKSAVGAAVLIVSLAATSLAGPVSGHPWLKPDLTAPVAASAAAPASPAPTVDKKKFDTSFKLATAFYVAAVASDHISTAKALERCEPCYEGNRLFRTKSGGANYAVNAAVSAIPILAAVYLEKKGHRRWARVLLYIGGSVRIVAAIHNSRIKGR